MKERMLLERKIAKKRAQIDKKVRFPWQFLCRALNLTSHLHSVT